MRKPAPSVRAIEAAPPGRIYYGENLVLIIRTGGTRSWTYRYTSPVTHRVTETSIGEFPAFSYSAARQVATQLQAQIAKGFDPVVLKRQERASNTTFAEACDAWVTVGQASWSNSQKYNMHLRLQVHGKTLLPKSVMHIDAAMVEAAIKPLMTTYPRQARRTLAVWSQVFSFAAHKKWRSDTNPAVWRGNMAIAFHGAGKLPSKNFAAMGYQQVPAFIARLRQLRYPTAAALECIILCAARTGEVRGMQWSEIDWDQKLWTIPAHRMKTRLEHTIPLSDRVLELLRREQEHGNGSPYVFLGRYQKDPLHEKSIRALLRYNMGERISVHGFRSTFRTWASEQTSFDFYAVEMCLSHRIGSQVTQAYLRGNAIEKRREIMAAWAEYSASASHT
jgi:integrase